MPEFCKHHIHESMYCGSCYKEALKNANARIASLEAQLEEARGIIEVVVEVKDDDCYYDHHGYCQAHNLEKDCHVAKAKNFIEQYMKDEMCGEL